MPFIAILMNFSPFAFRAALSIAFAPALPILQERRSRVVNIALFSSPFASSLAPIEAASFPDMLR